MTQPDPPSPQDQPDPRSAADAELAHMFRHYRGNSGNNEPYPADLEMASRTAEDASVRRQIASLLRERAYREATVDVPARREAEQASQILKSRKGSALEPIREKLRMARKPRMRTVEQFLCDHCDAVIAKPTDGYVVHGNIYVAEPSCRGGLIGNNFPEVQPGETITLESVKQTVYCKACFLKALGLEPSGVSPKQWEGSSAVGRDSIRRNAYNGTNRESPGSRF